MSTQLPRTGAQQRRTRWAITAAIAAIGLPTWLAGCGTDASEDGLNTENQPIIDGVLETGFPAAGMITQTDGTFLCSAALVAPDMVLTAAHCLVGPASNLRFLTGNRAPSLVSNVVRLASVHSGFQPEPVLSNDIAVVQLSVPTNGITPMVVNTGGLPSVGSFCTLVGYGRHNEPAGQPWTSMIKRSVRLQVRSASSLEIEAGNYLNSGNGLGYYGDSGGPLLCNGVIVGVQSHWPDKGPGNGNLPARGARMVYTTASATWVKATIAELRARDLWRSVEPSPISSQQLPYFAITTGDRGVPYIAYTKVPFAGEKPIWSLASTTSDPPGNLADLSGPALVYLSRADGSPGDFQVFVTGGNRALLEKHQTRGVWRTWGRVAPPLPTSRIASAPAAVAPRSQVDGTYRDPVVVITDERGTMWANVASINTDNSNRWGSWFEVRRGTSATSTLKFTAAPSAWADSFGHVRLVGVAGTKAFETTFDPATGASAFWVEIPGGGLFTSGVFASFRTDFEFTHVVEYVGLGTDVLPYSASWSLADDVRTGWSPLPALELSIPPGAAPYGQPMIGSAYDFENGHRPFVLMRSRQGAIADWWWRLLTDSQSTPWRKMLQ